MSAPLPANLMWCISVTSSSIFSLPPALVFRPGVSVCHCRCVVIGSSRAAVRRKRELERVRRTFLAELWEWSRATPPTPVSPCFLAFSACSQPFSCESSGNPTHMGPHMLTRLCVSLHARMHDGMHMCECPYVYTMTYHADQWTLVLQQRNSAASTKQEMNEVTCGGASQWPSPGTKGRARADELLLLGPAAGAMVSQLCT